MGLASTDIPDFEQHPGAALLEPMDVVAEQLGTNRNALYKLLHDARRKLKTALEADGLSVEYVLNLFQR